jgi:hypothetical protein
LVSRTSLFLLAVSRSTWIQLFLFLHIFGAVAAVGPTLTYAVWITRGERQGPDMRAFAVRGTSWVDAHLATPAFMAQAVTGGFLIPRVTAVLAVRPMVPPGTSEDELHRALEARDAVRIEVVVSPRDGEAPV